MSWRLRARLLNTYRPALVAPLLLWHTPQRMRVVYIDSTGTERTEIIYARPGGIAGTSGEERRVVSVELLPGAVTPQEIEGRIQ